MNKYFILSVVSALLLLSCNGGKQSSGSGGDVKCDTVKDTFYGCTFGEDVDSVLNKIQKEGLEINGEAREGYAELLSATEDGEIEFDGQKWRFVTIGYPYGQFSDIYFHKIYADEDSARNFCSEIVRRMSRKYDFVEIPDDADNGIYEHKAVFGKNGVNCTLDLELFEAHHSPILYDVILHYYSAKVKVYCNDYYHDVYTHIME